MRGFRVSIYLASFLVLCAARPSFADTCTGMAGGPGDLDGDGYVGANDCDDTNPGLWARMQSVGQVKLARVPGTGAAVLSWNPLDSGGQSAPFTYEVVRSRVASNFLDHPTDTCLDPGGTELQFTDPQVPPAGGIFFYIVRGRNGCGAGDSGTRSDGTPRQVRDCAFSVVCNDSNTCTDDSAKNGVCTHTPVAPKIVTGPSSIGVCDGGTARFTVEAQNGSSASYAWTKNGAPVGGNSPTLALPVTLSDHRSAIHVTVQDACGNITTPDATLTVFSDPAACQGGLNGSPAPNGGGDPEAAKHWVPPVYNAAPDFGAAARVDLHSGELEVAQTDMEIPGRGFDFVFTRYYRSRRWQSTSQGVEWTHAYDRRVSSPPTGGVVVVNPASGETLFAAPPPSGGCYVTPAGGFEELCPQADGTLALNFPDGQIWVFGGFDGSAAAGKILQSRDQFGNAMSFAYDTGGKLTTITDTLGRAITLTYNTRNLVTAVTDFTGRSVQYVYYDGTEAGGELDDLKSVTSPPVTGTPTGNDFPQGRTTTYTYSRGHSLGAENSNLLSIAGPDGKTYASFSYSMTDNDADPAFDRLYRMETYAAVNPADEMFTYVALTPDASNDFAVSKTIVKDATDHRSDYYYDAQGQIVRVRDFTGVLPDSATFASDLDNLPGPPPSPTDPPYYETKVHHDGNALVTELTMPSLASVSRVYDSGNPSVLKRGDLLSETFDPGPLGGDQAQITRSWTYATPFGTDWGARREPRIIYRPGVPSGVLRRISDVRIVHPPATPPGTWRTIKDIHIVHPPAEPPGLWRKLNPKLYQESVDPFAGAGAGSEKIWGDTWYTMDSDVCTAAGRRYTSDSSICTAARRYTGDSSICTAARYTGDSSICTAARHALGRDGGDSVIDPAGRYTGDSSICTAARYTGDSSICTAARHALGRDGGDSVIDPAGRYTGDSSICTAARHAVARDGGDSVIDPAGRYTGDSHICLAGKQTLGSTLSNGHWNDWGEVSIKEDCDDSDPGIFPGGREVSPGRLIAIGTSRDRTLAFGGTLPSSGFPTTATDENGQTWTFTYDTSGFLTDLQAPSVVTGTLTGAPQTIHHHWDRNAYGQIVAYTDPQSHVSTLDWSSSGSDNGYLRTLTIPHGTLSAGTQYTWSARGQLVGTTDPNGHTTTMTINDDDQVVRVTSAAPFSYQSDSYYDANGDLVRHDVQNVDENGVLRPDPYLSTLYVYDGLGRLSGLSREIDSAQCMIDDVEYDPLGRITKLSRGGSGAKLVKELAYARVKVKFPTLSQDKDELGSVWARQAYDYDADGNLIAVHDGIDPSVADTTFQYDGYGRLTKTTDAEGNEWSSHYDAAGNEVSSSLDGELADGSSGPNVKLAECTTTYDEIDRAIKCDCTHLRRANGAPIGDGSNTCLGYYDENSNWSRIQDDNGHGTDFTYDSGQLLKLVTDAMGNTTQLDYDLASNVIQVTETDAATAGGPPSSAVTHYEYDALDRRTADVDPAGGRTERKFDGKYYVVGVTHKTGNKTRYTYDGLGQLVQTQDDMTDTGDGNGNVVATLVSSQTWNDLGQLTSTVDAEGSTWTYAYDGGGRVSVATAPDARTTSLVWSPRSNLVSETDPDGSASTLTYDKLGRLTDVSVARGPGVAGTTSEHYVYDGSGALVSASDDDSTVTRTYDSFSRMLSETQQAGGSPPHTVTIERDAVGNPTSMVYPGGHTISYGYDPLDRTQTVFADGALVASYNYQGATKLSRVVNGNSVGTSYLYDAAGRLERKTVTGADGDIVDATITWDPLGMTSRSEPLSSSTTSYVYDSMHRLTKSTTTSSGSASSRVYTLSAMGDRVLVSGGMDAGSYTRDATLPEPADLQMHQYTSTPSGTRTYDADGNPLIIHGGTPAELAMTHDYRGNIVTAGGFSYTQDALGRYLLRAGVPLRFDSAGSDYIQEYAGGASRASFVVGEDGRLLQMIEDADINGNGVLDRYTYHTDEQGNVRALTDQSGAVVERYAYDDWGNPSFFTADGTPIGSSAVGNPFLYRGMLWEPETQLYRVGGTAYDPHIGRPIRCPSGLCRMSSSAGGMDPFDGEPPPASTGLGATIHNGLYVRLPL
ncbi:MAG TPA: DUF6531 domain-containing protein [Candidatus Polarisedimenticolaceae bacterium]|nr:DUF6531 domain-containing protein [Candidatus Polarisedimenticolaceae bacterium]